MSPNAKVSLTVVAVVAAVVTLLVLFTRNDAPTRQASTDAAGAAPTIPASVLVRPDSHKLSTAADGKVTVVEFLDLECEACGAAYPHVEKLRAEYGDRITLVIRYFPLPGHLNAELAARAVEAAGKQGKLEPMYKKMYETQAQWGDQGVDHRDTFLGFARELGLDMATFERDLDDPTTVNRVRADLEDGVSVGVRGTPTFFINGVRFQGPPTYDGLKAEIDTALTR
ncbi:DsbA family protein [Actinokineospora guangxiensis]|uniref:DsbA family protein n=1 Tax=Actinokineospora guangxiensis TaxID=1490288 RepID=A0ABW0ELY8_9PSEU